MILEQSGPSPRILVIYDRPCINAYAEGKVLFGPRRELLLNELTRAGIDIDSVLLIAKDRNQTTASLLEETKSLLESHRINVIVPIGEEPLNMVTGLKGAHDWHCSVLQAKSELSGKKTIPLLSLDYVMKYYGESAYITLGCLKIAKEMTSPELRIPERMCFLDPSIGFTIGYLFAIKEGDTIALDLETGRGQINTVGIATSPTEAIAIKTSISDHSPEEWRRLWDAIVPVLENPKIKKVVQNGVYETLYLSRYGIKLQGVIHDTMWCMKFLYPELEKGLHNVGRIFTPYPYWKKDGEDWNDIRDWYSHLDYNAKDTTGTYAGYLAQIEALKAQNLSSTFHKLVMRYFEVVAEMCSRGMLLDEEKLLSMRNDTLRSISAHEEFINRQLQERIGRTININSNKQLKQALIDLGYKLPSKKDKDGAAKESSDKKALVKLRRAHPDDPIFSELIARAALNKSLSSYLNFDYDKNTKRIHYMLDACGTESGRWSGSTDHLGWGVNPQTVPKKIRRLFRADVGKMLVQIDLAQAESRFVAWEAPEPKLMQMLEEGADVHKYVAARIFKKPEELVSKQERQLGKKSGHSANYGVGPRTFAEACLTEMGIFLHEWEARKIIDGYFEVFPGVFKRQARIKKEVSLKRKLITPLGRHRQFFGRVDDSMFREAYAYSPQSTIPDITNALLWHLYENFEDAEFLLQVHDSILLQVEQGRAYEIAEAARDYNAWHPEIILPGGKLIIPVEVEAGYGWEPMEAL